jgi:hypothetical protein
MKAGILTLVSLLALGYITRPLFRSFITSATSDHAAACLEMLGNTTTEENGITYIVGTVRNNCERKFGYVTVTFKLDRQPGPAENLPDAPVSAYSRDVGPGQTKEFKTVVPISKNSTYRFDAISAY